MKKILLSAFVLFHYWATFAQTNDPKADTTKPIPTIQSAADDRAKKLLPQFSPLSPNAASMQKFGDYQVNLATGIPSISIPLYTVTEGKYSVPITLDYHAGGFKLNEQASWVGLGWSLNYGASLNRTVQGLKDEYDSGSYLTNAVTTSKDFCNNLLDFNYGQSVISNQMDTQPDVFTYSLVGGSSSKSGRFILGQNGAEPFKIPDNPLKISYTLNPSLSAFSIINDDGNEFVFGGTNATESQSIISGQGTQSYISSWLISEIKSANSDDKINYFYQDGGAQNLSERQWVASMILNAIPQSGGHYQNTGFVDPSNSVSSTAIGQTNPHKIAFTNGEIEFIQSNAGERQDLNGSRYLKQINIYNYENSVKTLIRVIKFNYSYFQHNGINKRLKLDKVSFEGRFGLSVEEYTAQYWTNSISWNENNDNEKKDFFGYYNGKPNTHLIPVASYNGVFFNGGAADRSTVDTYMKEAVLKRLYFPTGGFTEFDFETNKYYDGNNNVFAGGLRVKSIKSSTGTSGFMKRYEYSSNAGVGIGRLTTNWLPSAAGFPSIQTLSYRDAAGTNVAQATQASFTQSGGAVDLNTFDTAPVYYTSVTEYFENDTDPIKNGRNVYEFDFKQDIIVNTPNYTTRDVQPWKRGNLLSKTTYDANNNVVEKQTNQYQEIANSTKTAAAFISTPNIYEGSIVRTNFPCPTTFIQFATGFPGFYPEMVYNVVNYQTGANLISNEIKTTDGVSTTRKHTYNNKLFLTQTLSEDSKTGDNYTESFTYPFDASYATDPIAQQMVARNQLNTVLENELKETISGSTSTIYKEKTVFNTFAGANARSLTNNILPAEMWEAPTGTSLEKRIEYKTYDNDGNLQELEKDGQPTTLLYGYNNSLVTAIVKNATLAQTNATLSSAGLTPSLFSVSSLSPSQETTLSSFRNNLANAHVDWYTHKPHIGLSQQFAINGLKTSYFYDEHLRFYNATDHEGNIIALNIYQISPSANNISTYKPRVATTDLITAILFPNAQIDVQHFDNLGRPTQSIGFGQSPAQNSIIKSEVSYDSFNRAVKSLLPVEASGIVSLPVANARALAQSFYADTAPVDSTIFESSPLNRPKLSYGVGQAWRAADKKTEQFYEAGGTEVRNYEIASNNDILLKGVYPDKSLYKKRILDEQGHETIEYTDLRGRMIEKRQELDKGVYAHTHYLYDGLSRPRAIIQPEGYELNIGFSYNGPGFKNWVFFYEYDTRGRVTQKHVPAAGFTKMVYDKKDRLVLQQDALQATLNKWNFMKYDAFDREAFKGETVNANAQTSLQAAFDTHATPDETWGSGGYNGVSFPSIANPSGNDVQHYSFYDQYDFVTALNTNLDFDAGNAYHPKHSSAKGLATGSVSYNQADHNMFYLSATYFDTKNRPIQAFETHLLNPTLPNRAEIEYNIVGDILLRRVTNKKIGAADITEILENEYDHVGRPLKIFHTINGVKSEIARISYDPIGRQILKKIKPGYVYKSGISDIIIRSTEPALNTEDYVRRYIQLNPGFVYCPDSLSPTLYLGEVDTLGIGGTTDALQTLDFTYNIRNGLRCVNCTNDQNTSLNKSQNDLFAMKLDFHETGNLFDGNIHKQSWIKANDNISRSYTYGYDASSRLKSATFQSQNNENFSLPNMSYDKNSNILSLNRKAKIGGSFGTVDDLTYTYSGNRLLKIEDAIADSSKNYFNNRNTLGDDFEYYSNGNLKADLNERISLINYNTYLNQPIEIIKTNGSWEKSFYDGSGHLFKRTNSEGTTWTYSGNIVYKNDSIYQIATPEGRLIKDSLNNFHYQFEYRDITGNLRLLYQDPTTGSPAIRQAPEIIQTQDYEPFGVGFNEYFNNSNKNRYGYSDHELISDFGLNRIDFGNRTYNPTYGRFDKNDVFSDLFESHSPFAFVFNSPLINIDIYGDSTVPVNNLNWFNFNPAQDEILLNQFTVTGTTDVGKQVAPAYSFLEDMFSANRLSPDGRMIDRNGVQTSIISPITGTIPDVGLGRVGTVYTAVKKGLPYIGKSFNILKRYSKSKRFEMKVVEVLKDIPGKNLLRAIEQKAIEYKRSITKIANERNAFNPKRKDYLENMQKAENWLNKNIPNWKELID